jgi:predicted transcriptional regulator
MTKREMFAEIRNVVIDNAEMVAFIDHEIELLNKKSSATRKPTKTQVENEAYKATILTYLAEVDAPKSIKELQAEVADLAGLTNQRVTHMLTDLVKAGSLTKEYVKKTPFYSIAA